MSQATDNFRELGELPGHNVGPPNPVRNDDERRYPAAAAEVATAAPLCLCRGT